MKNTWFLAGILVTAAIASPVPTATAITCSECCDAFMENRVRECWNNHATDSEALYACTQYAQSEYDYCRNTCPEGGCIFQNWPP